MEPIKNSYNSRRQNTKLEIGQRIWTNISQKTIQMANKHMKKMLDIISSQRNADSNHDVVSPHTHYIG